MRYLTSMFLLAATLCLTTTAWADDLTAKEIVDKSLDQNAMGFQSGKARITLQIQDKKGDERVRTMDVRSKDIEGLGRTRMELVAPKEVKGQAFLFVERDTEDDVWMYLPAFKVTRRIESGQKNGSFLGSHFTYADLESRDLKGGSYKRMPDEKIGKTDVYVVESVPKKGTSDYTKVVVWVRKSDFTPMRMRFFEKGDKVVKTLFVEKLSKTQKGQTYAKQMRLRAESGGFTVIKIDALEEAEISEAVFSKDQLGK